MTKPRAELVDSKHTRFYHVTSRCVRRAWLLGQDPLTGRNYDHRKTVLLNRLKHLSRFFSVKVMGYAIMSNHFHLVLRYDPNESKHWDNEEVARRWCATFNGLPFTASHLGPTDPAEFTLDQSLRYHELLTNDHRLQRCRESLGSLSRFMQHLKQPFAVWANHEDECKGHLFEMRFYSGVLLDEGDLLSCMAYVDLNPVEAQMAQTLRAAEHTSIHERLNIQRFNPEELDAYLALLWENESPTVKVTIRQYAAQLNLWITYQQHPNPELLDRMESWMARLVNRERRKRNVANAFFDYAWT